MVRLYHGNCKTTKLILVSPQHSGLVDLSRGGGCTWGLLALVKRGERGGVQKIKFTLPSQFSHSHNHSIKRIGDIDFIKLLKYSTYL